MMKSPAREKPLPTRRTFLRRTAAAVALPTIIPAAVRGAEGTVPPSERITVGCIGAGPRGTDVMGGFLGRPDAQVVAVCDVKQPCREAAKARIDEHYGNQDCAMYTDFREIVARDDIDAYLIASTDHWHVLHGLAVARAGKDMYLEKPMGLSVTEDRALRDACQAHGTVFQFGTQQRSDEKFLKACELVRNGVIGELKTIKVGAPASVRLGDVTPAPVPDWIDYDLWLGQAPWAPFSEERVSNTHWWHNSHYAIGFVAGWGIHHVDIAQWGNGTDDTGPVEIEGTGVYPEEGFCDCAVEYDLDCTYANGVRMSFTDNTKNQQGVVFEGTDGKIYVRRNHIEAEPASLLDVPLGDSAVRLYKSDHHAGNFLDCVKSRAKTVCPIETAVRSDTICHISDIAMRLGRKLRWDPKEERFVDDDAANRMLTRAMREPWRL